MKKLIMALAAALMLAACEKQELPRSGGGICLTNDTIEPYVTVTFAIGWQTTSHPMDARTRSISLAQSDMTDLWLFDYVNGECVNTIHLTPDDDDFGSPSASLTLGSHDIYFVASRGSGADIDDVEGTIVWSTVRDTFRGHLSLNVTSGTSPNQSVTLNRAVARLTITVNDAIPTGTSKLVIVPDDWYYGMNYVTGEAIESKNDEITINIPSSYIGTTGLTASCYSISGNDEWQTDVLVKAVNASNVVVGQVTIHDATFIQNVITECSGAIFSGNALMNVALNDTWGNSNIIQW